MGGREGYFYFRGGAYFKFRPIGGAVIGRGQLFEGAITVCKHGCDVLDCYVETYETSS